MSVLRPIYQILIDRDCESENSRSIVKMLKHELAIHGTELQITRLTVTHSHTTKMKRLYCVKTHYGHNCEVS